MSIQGTSTRAGPAQRVASHPAYPTVTVASPRSILFASGDPLLQRKYRELIRRHLSKLVDALFAEFTGLHFHVAWAPPLPKRWDARTMPTGCSVCCRLTGSPLLPDCRTCGPKHLVATLQSDRGHRFTCRLGVRNYWIPIQVRGEMLGIAYLQALERTTVRPRVRQRSSRTARARLRWAGSKVLSRLKFARATRFLQLIVQHVQTASLAELRKADLTSAGRAVLALEKEQVRLRATLKRHLPPASPVPRHSGPKSRAEQIVHRVLERIELDYAQPVTLQRYARELRMNAAYLSNLFSHAVGVPFKTYLTDLRLEKARELLGDPSRTVSDVGCSVGYASQNRFRIAFKKATGLPPKLWRETMQTNPTGQSA